MAGHEEEAAIHADAYIDALLERPRVPRDEIDAGAAGTTRHDPATRAADVLSMLPRFHPSFAFEEALAARLRRLADGPARPAGRLADVISFPGAVALPVAGVPLPAIDRRLLVGGAAIASGVSVAAVIAWWQTVRRPRPGALA